MASDWKEQVGKLQNGFDYLNANQDLRFNHAILLVRGKLPPEFSSRSPPVSGSHYPVIEKISIRLNNNVTQHHYLYEELPGNDSLSELRAFKQQTKEFPKILENMPKRTFPRFQLPAMQNGLDEAFVKWLLLMHWLDDFKINRVFHSEIQFCEKLKDVGTGRPFVPSYNDPPGFREWKDFSPLVEFDVLPLITATHKTNEGYAYWQKRHQNEKRGFPDVIAASLTKEVHYASCNAPNLLLQLAPTRNYTPVKRDRKSKGDDVQSGYSDSVFKVLGALQEYHGAGQPEEDWKCTPPLSVDQMKDLAGISQGMVSKALKKLFDKDVVVLSHGSAKARYDHLCEKHDIVKELEKLDRLLRDQAYRRPSKKDDQDDGR